MENTWESGYVKANGINIHYYRTHGKGPAVVLAHGFSDNGRCWRRVAGALGDEFDLIMFDARGHGKSDAPDTGYSLTDQAEDIAGLVEVLKLDQPALMGHSMGASSVAVTAAKYPELTPMIVLEDPPWRVTAADVDHAVDRRRRKEWEATAAERKSKSIEAIIADGQASSPTWDIEEFEAWAEAKKQMSLKVFSWTAGSDLSKWRDTAAALTCRVLLVTADTDRGAIVTKDIAQEATSLCDTLEVLRVDGAGHSIRREQFEIYVEAIRGFLGSKDE